MRRLLAGIAAAVLLSGCAAACSQQPPTVSLAASFPGFAVGALPTGSVLSPDRRYLLTTKSSGNEWRLVTVNLAGTTPETTTFHSAPNTGDCGGGRPAPPGYWYYVLGWISETRFVFALKGPLVANTYGECALWVFTGDLSTGKAEEIWSKSMDAEGLYEARCSFVPDRKTVRVYLASSTCELDPASGKVGPEVGVPPESEDTNVTKVDLAGLMDGSVVVVDPSGKGVYLHVGSMSDTTLWYCEPKSDPVRIGLRHEVDILWDGREFPVYGGNLVAVIRHDGRTRTALLSRGKVAEFEDRAGEFRMEVLAFSEDILVIQQALQDPGMGPQQFELRVYRISTERAKRR